MSKNVIVEMRQARFVDTKMYQEIIIKPLENIHAVVYVSKDAHNGHVTARAFTRKGAKPKFAYRFKTVEKREEFVRDWVAKEIAYEERKKAERKKRTSGHALEVGDVVNTSWGYDQTQCEFYQVIELKGKASVVVREVKQVRVSDSHVKPVKDAFVSEPFKKRVNGIYNTVKISSCQLATPTTWEDTHYVTPFGMGH